MSTLTRSRSHRPAERRRRPVEPYRPSGLPRALATASQPDPTPDATPLSRPHAATCEVCARTRRFERRAGQFLRRGLALAACAGLAAFTASPGRADPATIPPRPAAVPATQVEQPSGGPPATTPTWCTSVLLPLPVCPSAPEPPLSGLPFLGAAPVDKAEP
jgi:hypothetical protein